MLFFRNIYLLTLFFIYLSLHLSTHSICFSCFIYSICFYWFIDSFYSILFLDLFCPFMCVSSASSALRGRACRQWPRLRGVCRVVRWLARAAALLRPASEVYQWRSCSSRVLARLTLIKELVPFYLLRAISSYFPTCPIFTSANFTCANFTCAIFTSAIIL